MIITLLTDFGTDDYYVGAMKGVILSRSPHAELVDISHTIAPQNVLSAAYVLRGAYDQFPRGTIHLAVADPGVGSSRRGIILQTDRYLFVGPDNGLFSLAMTGGFLAPWLLGYFAEAWGIQAVMILPMVGSCMVFALVLLIMLESKLSSLTEVTRAGS